jgi:RHS repeat-associated protein
MELQAGSKEPLYQIMLARYYSSSLGRFMAVDAGNATGAEDPQSWNRYSYVRNNPLGRIDPDGKRDVPPHLDPKYAEAAAAGDRAIAKAATAVMGAIKPSSGDVKKTSETVGQLGEAVQAGGVMTMIVGVASLQPEIVAVGAAMTLSGTVGKAESESLLMSVDPKEAAPKLAGTLIGAAVGAGTAPVVDKVAGDLIGPLVSAAVEDVVSKATTETMQNCSGVCK